MGLGSRLGSRLGEAGDGRAGQARSAGFAAASHRCGRAMLHATGPSGDVAPDASAMRGLDRLDLKAGLVQLGPSRLTQLPIHGVARDEPPVGRLQGANKRVVR